MTKNTASAEPTTAAENQTQSLEDVYQEAGITGVQHQSNAAIETRTVEKPAAIEIPNAYDEGHKAFLQSLVDKQAALDANQQSFIAEKVSREASAAKAKLDEAVSSAIELCKSTAGLDDLPYDDKTKTQLIQFELDNRANADPKFKQLFDARDNSPASKAAWNKALVIVSKDIAKKFESKIDPTLVASRKALKAAQHSSATTETEDEGDTGIGSLTGAAFDQAWARMVSNTN